MMRFLLGLLALSLLSPLAAAAQTSPRSSKRPAKPKTVPLQLENAAWEHVGTPRAGASPLPPGVSHRRFASKLVGEEIGYCIYLPAAYADQPTRRFPVLYELHGNSGNEFTQVSSMKLLHEQIESGRTPPLIMVSINGGRSTFYQDSADPRFLVESVLMTEFLPHIDATYRTIADRSGRCIGGFSMGGRGATHLAIRYPGSFCSLFCQAGNVPRLETMYEELSPELRATSYFGADRETWVANDAYATATANRDAIKKSLRICIACGTRDGGHLPTIRDFHQHLVDLNVDHTYIELEGLAHKKTQMVATLKPIWFAYHVKSLRLSGAID